MNRNIGIKVPEPKNESSDNDKKNPFNGTLSIRGKLFEGKVVKSKAKILLSFKKNHLFTLVNLKDMEEVKIVYMHMCQLI